MSYSVQPPLLALKDFFGSDSNDRLVVVLSALDLDPLLQRLDRRRGRGRRGYSQRAMLQAVIASHVYGLHSMAELRRELLRNGSLRILCGIHSAGRVPSEDALSRLYARLAELEKEGAVENLHQSLIEQIRELAPEVGKHVAIDATSVAAWANGNRSEPADREAGWGKRGHQAKGNSEWWFGYKAHLAVDTKAELPLAYVITPANTHDSTQLEPLLGKLDRTLPKDHLEAVMADSAYDSKDGYQAIWARRALPIIDFNSRGWTAEGYTEDGQPLCECARPMRFLGRDRAYLKYGNGDGCSCREGRLIRRYRIDDDIRLHPPLPRHTLKWQRLYDQRTAAERVNSRAKEHGRLRTVRHRGLHKVRLHCALTILVMSAGCLGMMQLGKRQWARTVVQLVA